MLRNSNSPRRRGTILPFLAISLVALCGFVALAIDIGMIVAARTDCQNAADAAAFTGTRNLDGTWSQTYQTWGADFSGVNFEHRGEAVAMSQSSRYAAVGRPNAQSPGQPAEHGRVTIVTRQPSFSSPTRLATGTRTSFKKSSANSVVPSMVRNGRISMPGVSIGTRNTEMPSRPGAVLASRKQVSACCA